MKSVRDLLPAAEKRLKLHFPESFVQALSAYPLSEMLRWRLWPPKDWQHLRDALIEWDGEEREARFDFDEQQAHEPDGVVIGDGQGGDLLCLLARGERPSELGDAVYAWRHETHSLELLAARVAELEELLEQGGSELLTRAHDDLEPRSDRYWRDRGLAASDGVCAFCGSGLEGCDACPVCGRPAGEAPEQDAAIVRARALIVQLVADGALQLDAECGRDKLVGRVAEIVDSGRSTEERAEWLARTLLEEPEVADFYASDADLARIIAKLEP